MSHYKPYPKYKDSGVEWIGEVPEGWEVKRLRHISAFKNSSVDKKTYEGQAAVGLCNYTDVYYNEFVTKDLPFMQATASPTEVEQFSLQKGDVIITKDSEDPSDIGIPALVAEDVPGVVCGYHLTQIRAGDLNTARLIHRTMQSHVTQAYFFVEAPGITRYGLGQDTIGSVTTCLPPLNHRCSVADWIDRETARIDAIIAKKTRFIELLKEKRSALITHAVTKGINPNVKMKDSGVEWIGEVPEHWAVMQLKRAASICNGQDYKDIEDADGAYPVIGSGGEFARASSFIFNGESVLLGRKGTIDKPLYINGPFWTVDTMFYTRIATDAFPKFVYYSALTIPFSLYSTNTALPSMTGEALSSHIIAAPKLTEQRDIANRLDRGTARLDLLALKTKHSIDLLKERRSALISAAVTGQIDLREFA